MKQLVYSLTCMLLLFQFTTTAQPGSLDATFSSDGKVTTHFPLYNDAVSKASVIQPDGKIIVVGYSYNNNFSSQSNRNNDFTVVRYNRNGTLDNTFGVNGIVTTAISSGDDQANSVALQTDGKIVVVGYSEQHFVIIRYNTDGRLDNTFGTNGMVISNGFQDVLMSVTIQQDGRIVAVGTVDLHSAVVRYNSNGTLDGTFGINGIATTDLYDGANCVKLQLDGKIVVGGSSSTSGGRSYFALWRYTANGILDNTFGSGGKAYTMIGATSSINSIAIQSNGKIIAGGYSVFAFPSPSDVTLVRYKPNGTLDNTFGGDGIVVTHVYPDGHSYGTGVCHSLAIQSDGKIVSGGLLSSASLVARYNSNGTIDTSFASQGVVWGPNQGTAYSISIQGNGKILAAGYGYNGYWSEASITNSNFTIIRYNPNGSFDANFGSTGIVQTNIKDPDPSADVAQSLAILQDGKIMAGGYSYTDLTSDASICRFNTNGQLDNTFGLNGKITSNCTPGGYYIYPKAKFFAYSMAINEQSQQILLAGKNYNEQEGSYDVGLFWCQLDGLEWGIYRSETLGSGDDIAYAIALHGGEKVLTGTSFNGSNYDLVLMRYNLLGDLDIRLTKDIANGNDFGYSVAIQADGKIVVAGASYNGINYDIIVLRYLSDGVPDNSFGSGGVVKTSLSKSSNDYGKSVKIQPDGKIVVAGYTSSGLNNDFIIVRYNINGTLDNTFNSTGIATGSFDNTSNDFCNSAAIQQDGKIVIAGYYYKNSINKNEFALARYFSNGKPDGTFGSAGKVTTDFGSSEDFASDIAIQANGKLVVAGTSGVDFAVARYNSSGSLISKSTAGDTNNKKLQEQTESGSIKIFPNPVTSTAIVSFTLEQDAPITIDLHDFTGKQIKTVVSTHFSEGPHRIELSREGLVAGVYYLRMIKDREVITKKIMVN